MWSSILGSHKAYKRRAARSLYRTVVGRFNSRRDFRRSKAAGYRV